MDAARAQPPGEINIPRTSDSAILDSVIHISMSPFRSTAMEPGLGDIEGSFFVMRSSRRQ